MIHAIHAVMYTKDAEGIRAFFRDVLELPNVDAGGGWLIFALPPAELGIHPHDGEPHHQLYLMCDDIYATMDELRKKGVEFTQPVKEAAFGLLIALRLPDGESLYLYQPKHPSPLAVVAQSAG